MDQLITNINLFTVNHILDPKKGEDYLELKTSDQSCYAKIDLSLGGSLQELSLQNKTIISSKHSKPYTESFASAILFPFTNRVALGKYDFDNKTFQLELNELGNSNALHGLVYNKTFKVIKQETSATEAAVSITYNEIQPSKGFPFKYAITFDYVLTKKELQLHVTVKNTDQTAFPFSLGWHPYFETNDLSNSYLYINSHKKITTNDKMIPDGEKAMDWDKPLKIGDKTFDDCYILSSNIAELKTPEYHLNFSFSSKNSYLQLFTPDHRKSIAIEPQTAPGNSFNSKVGLQVLKPEETYSLKWKINIE
ncbi:aldose 1-epimerase [Flavobacteriaceae bacterium LMO-SS05]